METIFKNNQGDDYCSGRYPEVNPKMEKDGDVKLTKGLIEETRSKILTNI